MYLERTPQFAQSRDGRLSFEEYDAWRLSLDDKARAGAAAVGCTQQAMSYVLTAKAAASDELYRGLALAFHFDALPWEDFSRVELDDHQKKSATGYEAYLAQLYGQNFQAFAERQKQAAAEMLPPDSFGLTTWNWTADPEEDSAKLWTAQSIAAGAMEQVQFEVTAEANGYFVRPYDFASGMTAPALQRPDMDRALPIIDGPKYRLMDHGEGLIRLHSVAAMLPDRRLSLFFFGETAATKMADATVRLYVRQPPYPEGVDGYTIFDLQDFRDDALVFDGIKSVGACLGAPCYEFPVEATDALLANPVGDYAELFVSLSSDAQPEPIGPSTLGRERFDNQWMLWWADSIGAQR